MIVTTINRKDHAFKKRILSRALTPAIIHTMEESLIINTRRFCEHLLYTIKGEVTFNHGRNTLESNVNRHILKIIYQGVAGLNLVSQDTYTQLRKEPLTDFTGGPHAGNNLFQARQNLFSAVD